MVNPSCPRKWGSLILGIFSLAFFLGVGKFSSISEASKPITYTQTATQVYVASFSFDLGEFSMRRVIIEEASFNASGSVASHSPIPLHSADFPVWENSFALNNWNVWKDVIGGAVWAQGTHQMGQIQKSVSAGFATGTFLYSRVPFGGNLQFNSYLNAGDALTNPVEGAPLDIDVGPLEKPHAMIVTSTRCHFVWLAGNNKIWTRSWDGSNLSGATTFAAYTPDVSSGIGGGVIVDGGVEYPCFTYVHEDGVLPNDDVVIVVMTDSANPVVVGAPQTKTLVNLQSHVDIARNPRTGKIYLSYLSEIGNPGTAKILNGDYTVGGGWVWGATDDVTPPFPTNAWRTSAGISNVGLPNFENAVAMRKNAGATNVFDGVKRNTWFENQDISEPGFPYLFPCTINSRDSLGLLVFRNFKDSILRYRYLSFPSQVKWQMSTKVLHIEGPPFQNSVVAVKTVFPEIATNSTTVYSVNSGGGKVVMENATGVTVASGTGMTIAFDKSMMQASYTGWIGNQIKLYDAAANPLGITYYSGTASEVNFTINSDLQFDSIYQVYIASNVVDSLGTQLWAPATFSFRTQKTQTPPSGFSGIALFKDPARTTSFLPFEDSSATQTIHIRVTGTDGATMTKDVTTGTIILPWAGNVTVPLSETASNSGGIYDGSFVLSSIPIYAFPAPLPPVASFALTWQNEGVPPHGASLTVHFPAWNPASSTIQTFSGTAPASGATTVLLNSDITLGFSTPISSGPISSPMLQLKRSGTEVPATYTPDPGGLKILISPHLPMLPETNYSVIATFSSGGLKSPWGNPLYREFSFSFSTQASQTSPATIDSIALFPDNTFNPLTVLPGDSDFLFTGTIFIEARGADAASQTVDSTIASLSDGRLVTLTETTATSGIFRGSIPLGGLPDQTRLLIGSKVSPNASQTLLITIPNISVVSPASGATNVSVGTDVKVKASEALVPSSVTAASVILYRGATVVLGSTTYDVGSREITVTPATALPFSSIFTLQVFGVKDEAGNMQAGSFRYSFTSQASAVQPLVINSLKVFSDSAFSSPIASGAKVNPSQQVFIEVQAVDLSATSLDSTPVLVLSSQGSSQTAQLIETSTGSGIFRNSVGLFSTFGHQIRISSTQDPSFFHNLVIPAAPNFSGVAPASGSVNLPLDTTFVIKTNKDIDASTLSSSSVGLADSRGVLDPSVSLPNSREIQIQENLATGSPIFLQVKNLLKDTDGLPFPNFSAQFFTLPASFGKPLFFSDSGYSVSLAEGSQVNILDSVWVEVSGVDLYSSSFTSINAAFSDEISTWTLTLSEVSSGKFRGSFQTPNSPGNRLSVSLPVFPQSTSFLTLNPNFQITDLQPLDGAVWVNSDIWPKVTFSLAIDSNTVTSANFFLKDVVTGNLINGSLKTTIDNLQVFFQPAAFLDLLTEYEFTVTTNVKSASGLPLGSGQKTRFKTQGPPPPPSPIKAIQNYTDSSYSIPTLKVTDDGLLFVEVLAVDPSQGTKDSVWIRCDSSDSRMRGIEVPLEEAGYATGIYRGTVNIDARAGATVSVVTRADPNFFLTIQISERSEVVAMVPASGSTGVFLNQDLRLIFSKKMQPGGLTTGVSVNSADGKTVTTQKVLSPDGLSATLTPQTFWVPGTSHNIAIDSRFLDADGFGIASTTLSFTTLTDRTYSFDLLSGISPRDNQSVSKILEAAPGTITLTATTSRQFQTIPEARKVSLLIGTSLDTVILNEKSPGDFFGTATLPESRGLTCQAQLLFGDNPKIPFSIASKPVLLEIFPASGATNVQENTPIGFTFSRPIACQAASSALKVSINAENVPLIFLSSEEFSEKVFWEAASGFPVGAEVVVHAASFYDFLGQTVLSPSITINIGGKAGIQVYHDRNYELPITGEILYDPLTFVEVALDRKPTAPESVVLNAVSQKMTSLKLNLQQNLPFGRRFRGQLNFEENRGIPTGTIELVPGERLELTSANLPGIKRELFYKFKGPTPPTNILGIKLFGEKNYAQEAQETISQSTIFVEIQAEDLNWMVADPTKVKVYSDSDLKGFETTLVETEPHSGLFRGILYLTRDNSSETINNLKASPGDSIFLSSVTNSQISVSIEWIPEARLDRLVAWPSPARTDFITFSFYLTYPCDVELYVYDVSGEELHFASHRGKEGENRIKWRFPRRLANGVYMYKLEILSESEFRIKKRKFKGKFAVLR